jgi:hypothetical protein
MSSQAHMPGPEPRLATMRRIAFPAGELAAARVWMRQQGEMRLTPGGRWLPFQAEQTFSAQGLEFRWQARVWMAGIVPVSVVDAWEGGRGRLTAKLLGVLPVARSRGEATDQAEAQRGLAELPWRPFALRPSPWLRWDVAANGRLRAAYRGGQTQAAIEFELDAEGRVLGASTPARPRIVGRATVATPWSGRFGAYRRFGPVAVPGDAEAVWRLPEGPFAYWRARVIEYRLAA